MTTPHQGAALFQPPAGSGQWGDLVNFVGQGAFQVGSAAQNWGQNVTESFARAMMYGPGVLLVDGWSSVGAFLTQLGSYLSTLPLEALKIFQAFIPDWIEGAFDTVASAVETILNALNVGNLTMYLAQFQQWLTDVYNIIETEVHQILDIINDYVVTPITSRIVAFQDWYTNLKTFQSDTTGAVSGLADGLTSVQTAIQDAITAAGVSLGGGLAAAGAALGGVVADAQTNAQGVIDAVNNAAAGLTSGAGAALATAQANFNNLFNAIPQYLQGLSGTWGQSQVNAALKAQADLNTSSQSQFTAFQNAMAAVFNVAPVSAGNTSVAVDFTTIADQSGMSGIMLPGTGSGTGYMGVTSGEAKWQGGSVFPPYLEVFPTATTSDYQVIDVTMGSLNDLLIAGTYLCFPFRVNSARTSFLSLFIHATGTVGSSGSDVRASLYANVSGTYTLLASSAAGALSAIAPGGKFRIIAGDPSSGSPYAMQILYNGTPIITVTDTSHVSQLGAGQRYVGLQMGNLADAGKYPPGVKRVEYQDNPPPSADYPFSGLPTAGTKGRVYLPSDTGLMLRDNGTDWERFMGGPLGYFKAPPTSGWSTQGTLTWAQDRDGYLLTANSGSAPSSGFQQIAYRTLSPTSNYTATFYMELNAPPFNHWTAGIVLRNSSSGNRITFGFSCWTDDGANNDTDGVTIQCNKWSSSGLAGSYKKQGVRFMPGGVAPNWLRVRDDGTYRYFDCSYNGVDWYTFFSVGRTDYMTPDQIGFGVGNYDSGAPIYLRVRSFSGIS